MHLPQMSNVKHLSQNWVFSQVGGGEGTKADEWLAVSQFPTTVHVELLKHEKIPDPVSTFARSRPRVIRSDQIPQVY